jgi:hypothetical protein
MASMLGMGALGKAMGGDEGASSFGLIPALLSRKKKAATPGSAAGSTILTDAMARRSASV